MLDVGIERIGVAVESLADRMAHGVERKGYELMERRERETGAGIVSFRKPGWEAGELVRRLRAAEIATAPRNGWVRASPHFYISPEEIDRVVEALP